jgi:hypothetical protein
MTATPLSIDYDPDRWIHIPLDYVDSPWTDAAEWADWLAERATKDRELGDAYRDAVRAEALATALFPAEHVSFRFWHYPLDGTPTGFADIYVQQRDDDGATPLDLLPPLGFTAIEPVVDDVDAPGMTRGVRRLSLGIALASEDAEPSLLPRAEWLGVAPGWVCYVVSNDHDAGQLTARLDDLDALFARLDLGALSPR